MAKKQNKDLKEIGFSVFRLWTRYYKCNGFYGAEKNFISCFYCDEKGVVIENPDELKLEWPIRVWDKETNFEIIKKA